MKSSEIFEQILDGASKLSGRKLNYLTGNNSFTPQSVDGGRISGFRDSGDINISRQMVETYARSLEMGRPIHIDTALGGAGNERSALEALVAHLPNVGCIPRIRYNGKMGKHVIWFDDPVNTLGETRDVTDEWQTLKGELTRIGIGDLSDIVGTFTSLAARKDVGLHVSEPLFLRFAAALGSKRFVILSGLAGSGKTKLAQAFARWMVPAAEDEESPAHLVIPVGADWTGSDAILGYPDGLDPKRYVTRPALDLIQRAAEAEGDGMPHFLILDEMNLSHVERYFADLLSLIESGEFTELYRRGEPDGDWDGLRSGVATKFRLPSNLFIIGTVNVDETTYMFSPKVLDRANVIEFRVERDDLVKFLGKPRRVDLDAFNAEGFKQGFGHSFTVESDKELTVPEGVAKRFGEEMLLFFDLLGEHNAEFGFRVANEAARFMHFYQVLSGKDAKSDDWFNHAMDAVIVQKLLPKLHGSRTKLEGLLWAMAYACGADRTGIDPKDFLVACKEAGKAENEATYSPDSVFAALKLKNADKPMDAARYGLSFDKLLRMYRKLIRDQFVTFAEA